MKLNINIGSTLKHDFGSLYIAIASPVNTSPNPVSDTDNTTNSVSKRSMSGTSSAVNITSYSSSGSDLKQLVDRAFRHYTPHLSSIINLYF